MTLHVLGGRMGRACGEGAAATAVAGSQHQQQWDLPMGAGVILKFPPCRCFLPPSCQPQERAVTRGAPSCPLGSPCFHHGDRGRWQGQGTVPTMMGQGDCGAHISSARSRNGANEGCGAPRPCWGPVGPTLLKGTQGVQSLLQTAHCLRLARSLGSHSNEEEVYRPASSLQMLHRDAQHFFFQSENQRNQVQREQKAGEEQRAVLPHCAAALC